jgi:[acyl-carrier-protein] S-malonyltransferase
MLALLFPGQGSQQPGMGRPWVDHPSWVLVEAASEAAGRDVTRLLLEADAEELRRTEHAQLATFVLSAVVHDAVTRLGVRCGIAAGHSLGEYSALTAMGALAPADGVRLVAERGAAMQAAADLRPGTMAAVLGADDDVVAEACARAGGPVWVANRNGAGQVVIAGDPDAIAAAGALARELGARKVLALPVGGAFHTPFMAPAAERLAAVLGTVAFADVDTAIVANVDATPHRDGAGVAARLEAQLTAPVRWRESVERMVAEGATAFLELGPGAVLTGLAKRLAPGAPALPVATPGDLDATLALAKEVGAVEDEHEGEHLFAAERLVVSPAAGIFSPAGVTEGEHIERGRVVGHVAGEAILSPFRGAVMGLLAVAGERLTRSQPVAWLRTA